MNKLYLLGAIALLTQTLWAQTPQPTPLQEYTPAAAQGLRAVTEGNITNADYTFKDIKGNSYNLKEMLEAGKTVFIDMSTVWCAPCWQLHNSGNVEKLWEKYGPNGTGEMEVFWLECQGAKIETIKGLEGPDTKGDWTIGGTVPFPMVSDAGFQKGVGVYAQYFPYCVLIFPNGFWKEVTNEIYFFAASKHLSPEQAADAVYEAGKEFMVTDKDKPFLDRISPVAPSAGIPSVFYTGYRSKAPITSYKWSFEGAEPATSTEQYPAVTWSAPGTYTVTVQIGNKNGLSSELTAQVEVSDPRLVKDYPYKENFDGDNPMQLWSTIDADADFYTWTSLSSLFGDQLAYDAYNKWAQSKNNALCSFSYYPTFIGANDAVTGVELPGTDNWLISPGFVLPADVEKASGKFFITSYGSDEWVDPCAVYLSATPTADGFLHQGTLVQDFPKIPHRYMEVSFDLTAYAGQTVYVGIRHHASVAKMGLVLDDFEVTAEGGSVGIQTPGNPYQVAVEPGVIRVTGENVSSVRLFNLQGAPVARAEGASAELNTQTLPAGAYILHITHTNGTAATGKVIL